MKITVPVQSPSHRVHRFLFVEGTPFKAKVVQRKDRYKRAPKHRGREQA